MNDWPFDTPSLDEKTEYGTVVALIDDSGWGSYSDWLKPVIDEAWRRADDWEALLFNFLADLDIELFAQDTLYGGMHGTQFIGVAFSSKEDTLKLASEALSRLPAIEDETDD